MNAQPNGEHEVHTGDCSRLAPIQHRVYLGDFFSCRPAMTEAKLHFHNPRSSSQVAAR